MLYALAKRQRQVIASIQVKVLNQNETMKSLLPGEQVLVKNLWNLSIILNLLGKVSNSFGDLGGPWGHLQKGVNTLNSAMDNPTAALNSAVQGFKKAAGNIGKETDIPNSWASPSLIKYNPENARNFLGYVS